MKYIDIKGTKNNQTVTLSCSNIVMGTADFLKPDNMKEAEVLLDRYVELGGNLFDSARHYRHSEKVLGMWMGSKKNREEVHILTKGCHPVREAPGTPRVSPENIDEDLMTSLEYLKTDYVDLYALHRDNPEKPVGPIMEALHRHVEAGRIRAIGFSNWELDRIMEADNYAKENGLTRISFNSPNLSLAKPLRPRWENCVSANGNMIEWHNETEIPLLSWSAQAGGLFSGRFNPESRDNQEMVEVYYSEDNWERYERVKQLAEDKNVEPIQVSLSYVLNQKFPSCAIIGPANVAELESSLKGAEIALTEDEVNWIDLKK
ncbi:aldo/keto reductase [Virgibacillus necropolis]|uniref:Aldo/keto reductase n=1 Tax=Virgibacillus necropolis TaxID=163877 RepID=A0A221M9J8_9BACI|nr:aldo/keto reductase [Virgibacillus necropolis]ASN04323.1 aldo/keto reductase [Virgibacillus necropolis]